MREGDGKERDRKDSAKKREEKEKPVSSGDGTRLVFPLFPAPLIYSGGQSLMLVHLVYSLVYSN